MVVVPLGSLPLGFRFHPTDEELISHYLKGKINGRKPQVEVIPEIDVCKCEPWDLPGKSLIRTVDPEWFFFAPRDRKYPNGHRSNRATEAGYWKATGKDRTIKSRTSSGNVLIGRKKTLVFYRGRAPKGERTGWIMHEYRTVENEVDGAAGDQGAYVLCRLFKKPLERTPTTNYDELDEDGFSPTPTKSSPGNIEQAAEHGEEFDTAVDKKDLVQQMQEDQEPLTHIVEKHGPLDEVIYGMYPPKPEDSNSNISLDVVAHEVWSEDNNALNISFEDDYGPSPLEIIDNCEFGPMDSPNIDSNFPVNPKIVHGISTSPDVLAEEDPITKFLDSVLCDPDEFCLEESNRQRNSTADIRPEHINQINGAEAGPLWDLPWHESFGSLGEVNAGLGPVQGEMENASCLLAIPNSWDSLQSSGLEHNTELRCAGSEDFSTPWPLFNDLPDSTSSMISLDGCDGFDSTGIKVRPRQSQHHRSQASDQGTATRRIRLARKLQMECSMSCESSSNTVVRTTKALTTDVEEDTQEKVTKAEVGPVDIDKLGSSRDDEICLAEKAPDTADLVRESKSVLRHRQPNNDTTPPPRGPTQNPRRAKGGSASVYLAVGAVLLIILIMFLSEYL